MEIRQLLAWVTAGIITVAIAGNIRIPINVPNPTNSQADKTNDNKLAETRTTQTTEESQEPRQLTITVRIAEPEDLKVNQGSNIKTGQIIASRDREKQRLEAQKKQLNLSLQKLQSYQP